jgi:hypothetical protein
MWHFRAMIIAMAGVYFLLVPSVRADSLQLKNGNFVQGKYRGGTERAVQFEANGKIRVYDIDEILSINFAAASADGGIPSNDEAPKTSTNSVSNFSTFSTNDPGGLRATAWSSRVAKVPRQRITLNEKQCGGAAQEPLARDAGASASSPILLEANFKTRTGGSASSGPKVIERDRGSLVGISLPASAFSFRDWPSKKVF